MPYATAHRTATMRRTTARRGHAIHVDGGPGAPLSRILIGAFALRGWISFDPPTTALPVWIEITGFIDSENAAITITHGRVDGIADVNATTVSLTVDDTDGRFDADNTSGVWYGLIRKGAWLRLEILPSSGLLSERFTGFITTLPTVWEGQYATSTLTASDRYFLLGQAETIKSALQSEVLTDPNLSGRIKAYYNLNEESDSVTFGDTSGQGAPHLVQTPVGGVPVGTGFTAANADAPGLDSLHCPSWTPPTNTTGTWLTTTVGMNPGNIFDTVHGRFTGLWGVLEFWFQATTVSTQQFLAAVADPTGQFAAGIVLDSTGYIGAYFTPTAVNAAGTGQLTTPILGVDIWGNPLPRVDDGAWHHIVFAVASTSNGTGLTCTTVAVDNRVLMLSRLHGSGSSNLSQLILGGGYDYTTVGTARTGTANLSDACWGWADVLDISVLPFPASFPPDYASHIAATTGFLGETTDQRVARVARYAGVPVPTVAVVVPAATTTTPPGFAALNGGTLYAYAGTAGPWTNLQTGAHTCGSQSMAGRAPLDVMREAARAEGMPLFVDRSGNIALQPSTTRQNTTPAWSVDAADLDPNTKKADDFAYTSNRITITPNGQAAQVVTSAAGQASVAKYGVFAAPGQATANSSPVEARSLGAAIIALRADPPPRLSPIAVEAATLSTQAGYGAAWYDTVLATEISTPIRVTDMPVPGAGGGTVDALVEGWTETITAGNHTFAFNVSPIQGPTYVLDDPVLGRLDTDGSTLALGCGLLDVTIEVATTGAATGSALWTTSVGDFPLDINVGGEQMTISGITGASSPQTFSISARAVNGVLAAHTAGTNVALWEPLTLAY